MAKYKKKPVVVEAVQLRHDTIMEVVKFAGAGKLTEGKPEIAANPVSGEVGMLIPTLEGTMTANEGDWIIRGVKGELYPCKPDVFDATYEPVEE